MCWRSVVSGKSRVIGPVVANLNSQFYPEALEKLSSAPTNGLRRELGDLAAVFPVVARSIGSSHGA
jgi:hypothetical protein